MRLAYRQAAIAMALRKAGSMTFAERISPSSHPLWKRLDPMQRSRVVDAAMAFLKLNDPAYLSDVQKQAFELASQEERLEMGKQYLDQMEVAANHLKYAVLEASPLPITLQSGEDPDQFGKRRFAELKAKAANHSNPNEPNHAETVLKQLNTLRDAALETARTALNPSPVTVR